jgi:hypothetical protein
MDPLSLLKLAAEGLWVVIDGVDNNELSLEKLGTLVNAAVPVAEAAAANNPTDATPIIQNLARHAEQGKGIVERVQGMNKMQRIFNMRSLEKDMALVSKGIRDCLSALSAGSFHLSQQNQERLISLQRSLSDWNDQQQQALQDLQVAEALRTSMANAQHEAVMESLMAIMAQLDVGAMELAQRMQRYSQRRVGTAGASPGEQQVDMH